MSEFQYIIDKIREIFSDQDGFIPLHAPLFIGNEKKYLEECIDSTFVSSVGKFVDLFEGKIAEYTGVKSAVACVNGTNALHLALKLVGVGQNDEVLTQPVTFIATANAITYCGAHPVFLDVDLDTMGLSPKALLNFLETNTILNASTNQLINSSTNRPVTACVPMHTFGHPCKIDEIVEICTHFHLPVVEDAAESIGSYYKGKHTGTFGKVGVISFNGNKTITTGGGGMLLFNDEELANQAKHLTTQAKLPHPWDFVHDEIGYNYRMPNINAAIGVAQLENLDLCISRKRSLASAYSNFFIGSEVSFFNEPVNSVSSYWLNAIAFKSSIERDRFLSESNGQGVMTRPIWRLMNKLPMFEKCQHDLLENAEWLEERIVTIPSSVLL